MNKQNCKLTLLMFVAFVLTSRYLINASSEGKVFQVGQNHIKYHANQSRYNELNDIKQLHKAYSLENIHSLDISFSMCSLSLSNIQTLLPTRFKPYKTIHLNLGGNPIGTTGVDYVLSLIPNGVEELWITFDSIEADDGLGSVLAKRLNNINSIKSLTISLILAVTKGDVAISEYFRFSRPSPHLQTYSLILIGNGLTSTSLQHFESHLQRTALKVLDLNFYANKLGAEGATLVSQALKTQKTLEKLSVDFYFNNITQIGTQQICKSIKQINHQNLQYLNLNFDFNYIKNQGGKAIGNLLPHLKNIQSLHIGVAFKNFAYIGYKHIINGLSTLVDLKELSLRCGVNRVGYNGAAITAEMLKKLTKLAYLDLGFNQNYIGDQGLVLLSDSVSELSSLKKVYLNLGFNDARGYGLVQTIQNLVKHEYEELYLGLSSNQFKDTEVKLALNELAKLIKNSKLFVFEFVETAISKQMKTQLEAMFRQWNNYNGNKAIIKTNSVITDEQEHKYNESAKQPQRRPSENQQAELQTEGVQENTAEDTIEIDSVQTEASTNAQNENQQAELQTEGVQENIAEDTIEIDSVQTEASTNAQNNEQNKQKEQTIPEEKEKQPKAAQSPQL